MPFTVLGVEYKVELPRDPGDLHEHRRWRVHRTACLQRSSGPGRGLFLLRLMHKSTSSLITGLVSGGLEYIYILLLIILDHIDGSDLTTVGMKRKLPVFLLN